MAASDSIISCTFSLFDEGRKYTGRHRKYLLQNAKNICYSPETREKIKLREAFGFYGHGCRQLAKKASVEEVEAIELKDGNTVIISNIPSNVTLAFDVTDDGTITHTQEILDTEPGRIVSGLHASKVGGFSWACSGDDRGMSGITHLSGFSGFDYVLAPGFSGNRGYVLESANGDMEQLILESVAATVGDDAKAEQYVKGWMSDSHARLALLEEQIFASEARQAELLAEQERLGGALTEAVAARLEADEKTLILESGVKELLSAIQENLPFFIPEPAMHDMLNGDFSRARIVFESASRVDFSQFPLSGGERRGEPHRQGSASTPEDPEYGSAKYGLKGMGGGILIG